MATTGKYDVIIVGGGHNGLVTAAYLARGGKKVLVLERREMPGGCAVTEELWPGYRVSTGAYLVSLMQERIVRELELERFGYHVFPKDPAFFSVYPDGRHLFFWQDEQKTLAEIAKFSARDAAAFPRYEAYLESLAVVVESLLLVTPPELPPKKPGDFIEYLKLLARFRKLGPRYVRQDGSSWKSAALSPTKQDICCRTGMTCESLRIFNPFRASHVRENHNSVAIQCH